MKNILKIQKIFLVMLWTNWYDFLHVDTNIFIQDKNIWKSFCQDNNVLSVTDYYNLCNIYKQLPREPSQFYNGYTNLGHELSWKYPRRR